jgi:SAM-dependent methyltransferase
VERRAAVSAAKRPNSVSDEAECPVCRDGPTRRLFEVKGYEIIECAACSVAFYRGAESVERIDDLFPDAYFTDGGAGYPDYLGDEAIRRRQARAYLRRLSDAGVRGGRALDAGCAAGFFMDEARRAGWDVIGCDVNRSMVTHAQTALDLDARLGGFLDLDFEPGSYDLITMFGALEHLPKPRLVMKRIHELLKPGGAVAIETWNRHARVARALGSHWHVYAPPSCLWYHTQRSLRRLFAGDRWVESSYRAAPKWISVRHGLSALEHMVPKIGAAVRRKLDMPVLGELAVPYPGDDLVFAIFQREVARSRTTVRRRDASAGRR